MELLKEIFTTYWSQVTLLILGIGYFIKRAFDAISNKREINHNLFQQHRINAVNDFFLAYAKTEQMWKDLSIYKILEHKINVKEIDEIIFEPVNELRKNVLQLQIYFNEEDYSLFNGILENVFDINGKLSSIYFHSDKDTSVIVKANEFGFYRDEKLKENKEIFILLSQIIKKTFN